MTEIQMIAQHELRNRFKDAVMGHYSYCGGSLPRAWVNTINNVGLRMVFNALSVMGMVRIERLPDDLSFDDLVGDMFNEEHADTIPGGMRELEAQRKRMTNRIEVEGQWFHVAKVKPPNQHWEDVDSIGGFIGDDFHGSGYDDDLRMVCIDQILHHAGLPLWSDVSSDPRDRALLVFTMLQLSGFPIRQHWIDNATWSHTRS